MGCVRTTTKREVLQRSRDLLESSLPTYKSRIFVMASGEDLPANLKDHDVLTISIAGGSFAYGEQSGAGENVVPYQGTLKVRLWKTSRTDRQGADEEALLSEGFGVYDLERDILRAMLGSQLPGVDGSYDPILTQACYGIDDSEAERTADGAFGSKPRGDMSQLALTVSFGVDFHWNLEA